MREMEQSPWGMRKRLMWWDLSRSEDKQNKTKNKNKKKPQCHLSSYSRFPLRRGQCLQIQRLGVEPGHRQRSMKLAPFCQKAYLLHCLLPKVQRINFVTVIKSYLTPQQRAYDYIMLVLWLQCYDSSPQAPQASQKGEAQPRQPLSKVPVRKG